MWALNINFLFCSGTALKLLLCILLLDPNRPGTEQLSGDKHATEGETVVFPVKQTGSPHLKPTWYHNGEPVVANYSTKLAKDGTLTLVSTKTRHSGVYQLVIGGKTEQEVILCVQESRKPTAVKPSPNLSPIPINLFVKHVQRQHENNNQLFNDNFEV